MRKFLNKVRPLLFWTLGVILLSCFFRFVISQVLNQRAKAEQGILTRELTPNEVYRLELYTQLNYNYADYRLLSRVIGCETIGNPNAKEWNEMAFNPQSNDYGLFQINFRSWDKKAKDLGFENYKDYWKDNMSLGVWIYKNSGIHNWNWSRHCWK